jgi:hypothetical protein
LKYGKRLNQIFATNSIANFIVHNEIEFESVKNSNHHSVLTYKLIKWKDTKDYHFIKRIRYASPLWIRRIWESLITIATATIIAFILGLLTGKSCNQQSNPPKGQITTTKIQEDRK